MNIENLNDKTTIRELRRMLFGLNTGESDRLCCKLYAKDQDHPANADDIVAAKVIAFDELIAKKTA